LLLDDKEKFMKKLTNWFATIDFKHNLKNILAIGLAGIFLVVTTACSSGTMGGMNSTDAKVQTLQERAEQNLDNRTGNPAEAGRRAVEDLSATQEELGDSAEEAAENIGKKAKAGLEEAKEETEDFLQGSARQAEDVADTVTSKANRDLKKSKRALEDTVDAAENKAKKDLKTTKRALEDAEDAID
jgi:ElaB/YqjD/DUF883 family membrane-anchored ribosome-binding protein